MQRSGFSHSQSRNRSWSPNSACHLPPWKHWADWHSERRSFHFSVFTLERLEEMMEGKQRQTEELDEFYILCLVMNDLWQIYSRLNMHSGWGVNSLIHGRRNIQGCTYMGTGLWNETNSVNLHWKTVSFNLRLFMGKRFYQLVWINTVVQYNNNTIIQNKRCETLNFNELWCHMQPRVSYSFWFSISVINKKCLHALLLIRWTSFECSN